MENQYKKKITPAYNSLDKITFEHKVIKRIDYIKYKKDDNNPQDDND